MTDTTTTTTATAGETGTTAAAATTDSTTTTASGTGEASGTTSTTSTDTTTAATTPVEYAAFKLPDGYTLDGERLTALKDFAKANNWTQEQAQAAVDKHIEMSEAGLAASRDAKVVAWADQSRAEFGANFETIKADAIAGRDYAMKQRPNILDTFEREGWGSNPDALWLFAEVNRLAKGSSMQGLGNETASTPAPAKSPQSVLYPNEAKA